MKTSELISSLTILERIHATEQDIHQIAFDSRNCIENSLFVAIRGTQVDGHQYIEQAINKGSRLIICENLPETIEEKIQYIRVADCSIALGQLAAAYYGNPSQHLKLTGVTGTNGKTSVASLLFQLFSKLGYHCGLISTIENRIGNQVIASTHTTPDPVQLHQLIGRMVKEGVSHCFMEVSSHSLDQNRIAGLEFACGIFTNITLDHLDYHETFENYIKAKKKFFDQLSKNAFVLTNIDDRNGRVMVQNTLAKTYTYSRKGASDFKVKILESHFDGLLIKIDGNELWTPLLGTFNADNILAVYATAILLGEKQEEILTSISTLEKVSGRFDTFISGDGINVIIDYAHTPDALENVLKTIHDIRRENQRIITVVGAGGDRDKSKRPIMAKIGSEWSDQLILTSDNPRFEEPGNILNDMEAGITNDRKKYCLVITDRKQALKTACLMAKKGDIILAAGKGHEKYQIIKDKKLPFDDAAVIREFLEN